MHTAKAWPSLSGRPHEWHRGNLGLRFSRIQSSVKRLVGGPERDGSCSGLRVSHGIGPATNVAKQSPVSTGQLKTFLSLHTRPINHLDLMGALSGRSRNGILILRSASRLDAFSGYPIPT